VEEDSTYSGFSCPYRSLDAFALSSLAAEYAASLIVLFLERFSNLLEGASESVVDHSTRFSSSELPFEVAWSPALGAMFSALQTESSSVAQGAAVAFLTQAVRYQ
jgi:hypothetical protein